MVTRSVVPDAAKVEAHYAQSAERRRSGRRLVWGIVIGFLLLMLTLVVLYLAWQMRGRGLLRTELAAIKASGDPLTTAEITAWNAVPAGERDVTAIWLAAIEPFNTPTFHASCTLVPIVGNGPRPPALSQPLAASDETTIQDFLALHQDKIAAVYAAAAQQGTVRIPRDFRDGYSLLPDLQQLRSALRVLHLQLEILAREPNLQGAINNLRTQFSLGEVVQHDPLLISMLLRDALEMVTLKDIQRLAATGRLNDAQLVELQTMVRARDYRSQLSRAMIGERANCYRAFHQVTGFTPVPTLDNLDTEKLSTTDNVSQVSRPEDCAMALQLLTEVVEATEKPLPDLLDFLETFDQRVVDLRGADVSLSRVRYSLTAEMLPAISQSVNTAACAEVVRDQTDIVLAIERYRLKHGSAPPALTDLLPDLLPKLPVDSFDGQPMRYLVTPQGVLVYSIGRDRRDDGGMTDSSGVRPDITCEVTLSE